jgi:catechol 2,3-dioxygenase-like lactoylglutathione lyase family enzyme
MEQGIKHIEFWVSNLKKLIDFYSQLFPLIGWKQVDANSFAYGETKIYFIEQAVDFSKNIGPRHICFLAKSREVVNKVGEFLKNINAFIIRGPLESKYKNRSSYTVDFKDPDGYIIEVATKSISL